MRQVSIKYLKNNLSKELKDLPFEVTYHGKVMAVVAIPAKVATSMIKDFKEAEKVATSGEIHNPVTDTRYSVENGKIKGKVEPHQSYFKTKKKPTGV